MGNRASTGQKDLIRLLLEQFRNKLKMKKREKFFLVLFLVKGGGEKRECFKNIINTVEFY